MRKEEGINPVIATVLMIAVTIVLASVLYVTVIQNLLVPPYAADKLVATLTEDPQYSYSRSVNFTITMTSPEKTFKDKITITIVKGDVIAALRYSSSQDIWTNFTAGGKWHYEARLIDLDADGNFSDGDRLWVYVVDDNPNDGVVPPAFHTGDRVLFSIMDYHGVSAGGVIKM